MSNKKEIFAKIFHFFTAFFSISSQNYSTLCFGFEIPRTFVYNFFLSVQAFILKHIAVILQKIPYFSSSKSTVLFVIYR